MKILILLSSLWVLLFVGCSQVETVEDSDGLAQSQDAPDDGVQVEKISSERVTSMKVEQTILPSFSVTEVKLFEVLDILSSESKKYGEQIGYRPVRFLAKGGIANRTVTLTVKGNSMKTVCEVLSEQLGCELTYGVDEILFSFYDTD